ncbi:hypothetical protein [Alloalcanivorax xenomutans]
MKREKLQSLQQEDEALAVRGRADYLSVLPAANADDITPFLTFA